VIWNIVSHIFLGFALSILYTRVAKRWVVIAIFGLFIVELTQLEYSGFQFNWDYLLDMVSGSVGVGLLWLIKKWV